MHYRFLLSYHQLQFFNLERIKFNLTIALFMAIFACREEAETRITNTTSNKIFTDVLYAALDSLADKHKLQGVTILHQEVYPDQLKISTLDNTLRELEEEEHSLKITLVRDLREVIDDIIFLDLPENKKYKVISNQQEVLSLSKKNQEAYIMNLSDIAFDKDKKAGCFYFAIHCGSDCSSGYLIFIKKRENKWVIAGIIPRWHD